MAVELKLTEEQAAERLRVARAKVLAARSKRVRPGLDTKVLTAWNGQMIAGYATAGRVFKEKAYTGAAATAADFVLTKMRDKDGRLFRLYAAAPGEKASAKGAAFIDDYAYVMPFSTVELHQRNGIPKRSTGPTIG